MRARTCHNIRGAYLTGAWRGLRFWGSGRCPSSYSGSALSHTNPLIQTASTAEHSFGEFRLHYNIPTCYTTQPHCSILFCAPLLASIRVSTALAAFISASFDRLRVAIPVHHIALRSNSTPANHHIDFSQPLEILYFQDLL